MVKVPERDAYKLYFTIFSLLEETLKKCLDIPIFQESVVDEKNQDIYFLENMKAEEINNAIQKCMGQFSFLPAKNIVFTGFVNYLYNKTINAPNISNNFVLKMKIYKLIYNIALIHNKQDIVLSIIDIISNNISKWDDEIFQYWFGEKVVYLKTLKEFETNRKQLEQNYTEITKNSKISKLPTYSFLG